MRVRPIRAAPPTACARPPTSWRPAAAGCRGPSQLDGSDCRSAGRAPEAAGRSRPRSDGAAECAARSGGRPAARPSAQEIDKMVNDRQQVSDDLSHLTQRLRDCGTRACSDATRGYRQVARRARRHGRKRSGDADAAELGFSAQRPFSDPVETALTSDLQKLGQDVATRRALWEAPSVASGRREI